MNDPVNLQTNLKEALLTAFNKYKEKLQSELTRKIFPTALSIKEVA